MFDVTGIQTHDPYENHHQATAHWRLNLLQLPLQPPFSILVSNIYVKAKP